MTLVHDLAGQGPAVLLLHSSVCDRRMWDAQWRALADSGHRVIRCDFRGFGDTPAGTGSHDDADDVLELLDSLGVERTALVGASFGGKVALELAARRPERIGSLLLLCAGQPGRRPGPRLVAFGEREDALIESGDLEGAVELNVSTWLGPDADEATRDLVRKMQRHAFEVQLAAHAEAEKGGAQDGPAGHREPDVPDLARIEAPCLAVSGAHDVEDFRLIAAGLPGLIPSARHLELPWAGHLPGLERPAETTALITDFLAEHAVR